MTSVGGGAEVTLTRLNLLNIKSEIWRGHLMFYKTDNELANIKASIPLTL